MSNSPVTPREKLSAYQRWELHSFDDEPGGHAQTVAEPVVSAADKIRHLHEHAYEAGLAEGLRRGQQKASEEARQLQALLTGIHQRVNEDEQRVANAVLALALEVARQMVRRTLKVDPAVILPVVQEALARVTQPAAQATLYLHPEDAAVVREHLGTQLATGGWTLIEDGQLARGGCKLDTAASHIDATVATRWQQLAATLGQNGEWLE